MHRVRNCLLAVALGGSVLHAEPSRPAIDEGKDGVVARQQSPESEVQERIRWLRAEIARHDELYFRKAAPEITDFAYDALKRELKELERQHPGLVESHSTAGIGDDRTGLFPSYRHRERMLSLAKAHTKAEVDAFLRKLSGQLGRDDVTYVIEPKFDGLAISVTYEKGKLVRAVTRGNGIEGDDVTANVRTIRTLPAELRSKAADGGANPIPDTVELRGEIFIGFAEFARINRERDAAGESTFAHPRNLAAGTLKLLDPAEVAQRRLEIVFYGWGAWEPESGAPGSQQELHALLRRWGLPAVENYRVAIRPDEVWNAVQAFGRERSEWGYPTDGAVIKLDDAGGRKQLGANEEVPFWAIAYKFAPERAETRLRAIALQVGRTGLLTPVAELDPVQLNGTSISRASLHNRDEITRGDYRIGDYVWIEKAGEVIPQVAGVDLSRRTPELLPYEFPRDCPVCHSLLLQVTDEVAVRCPNPACPAQVRRRVQYFASRACVAIDGLGPATVDALVQSGRVTSTADLYGLTRQDLTAVSRMGDSSAERLLTGIERSKHAELWRFILGLGIPGVGPANAKVLARRFGSLEALASVTQADLAGTQREGATNLGAAVAASVAGYFELPENRNLVSQLLAAGVKPTVK